MSADSLKRQQEKDERDKIALLQKKPALDTQIVVLRQERGRKRGEDTDSIDAAIAKVQAKLDGIDDQVASIDADMMQRILDIGLEQQREQKEENRKNLQRIERGCVKISSAVNDLAQTMSDTVDAAIQVGYSNGIFDQNALGNSVVLPGFAGQWFWSEVSARMEQYRQGNMAPPCRAAAVVPAAVPAPRTIVNVQAELQNANDRLRAVIQNVHYMSSSAANLRGAESKKASEELDAEEITLSGIRAQIVGLETELKTFAGRK